MDISQIKRTRKVEVTIGEDTITLEYCPNRWTSVFVEKHNALLNDEDESLPHSERGKERFIFTILSLVASWDLTQDGEPFPLTEQNVSVIDDLYLYLIYASIRSDIEAREKAKN